MYMSREHVRVHVHVHGSYCTCELLCYYARAQMYDNKFEPYVPGLDPGL
jgi:hypothetical protein